MLSKITILPFFLNFNIKNSLMVISQKNTYIFFLPTYLLPDMPNIF